MWIRETADGIEVDVAGVMEEIDKRRGATNKRLKRTREEAVNFASTEADETFVLKAGEQYFKLVAVKESSNIEDLLKEGYEKQLETEKARIVTECDEAMKEFKAMAESSLKEAEGEIKKLEKRLRNSSPMPEITYAHAKAGLSVVKGDSGRLIWLFHTVYAPQFLDEDMLSPAITKKMTTPMVIMITTSEDVVHGVETRSVSLDYFRHYHRHGSDSRHDMGSDCWGQWKWHGRKVKSPDEVLALAKEATNVLAKVNSHSPACRSPLGLPRLSTLATHVIKRKKKEEAIAEAAVELNPQQVRAGLDTLITNRGGWTVRN
jgi:hypothetical protein